MVDADKAIIPSATFSDSAIGAYTLAPQTTPFAPTATPAAVCNSRSVLCFTTAGQLVKGYACDLVDHIDAKSYQYLDSDCYPPHYDLVNHGEPNLDRTLAYPGTACPSGFTPACTTTLTLTNPSAKPKPYTGTLTQTWCCPKPAASGSSNNWVCTDRDHLDPTSRLCLSLAAGTNTANVWFTADPALAAGTKTAAGGIGYTTSAVGSEMSMKVIRAAFPLGEADQDVLNGLAGLAAVVEGDRTTTTTSSGGGAKPTGSLASGADGGSNGGGTNGGTIAGIVVGCLALFGFIALGLYMCVRYRREGKEEKLKRKLEAEAETGEQRLIGHAAVGKGTDGEKSKEHLTEYQVGAVTELPVPCSRPAGRFTEMGGDSGAVEMPTDYNQSGR